MVEETSLAVSRALSAATGMTGGQFGILSILTNNPFHLMRQQDLADAMRWDRTRLSHVLTRMEARGWITRRKGDRGATLVSLAEEGQEMQASVAPVLGQIVRENFFNRLTGAQLASLQDIYSTLSAQTPGAPSSTALPLSVPAKTARSGRARRQEAAQKSDLQKKNR
jgi:DNA-binding MarR family transcriptional regulator